MKKFLTGLLGIAATANPLVGGALSLVNNFLPEEKKLSPEATGQQITHAYDAMPQATQQQIDKQAEIELAEIQAATDKLGHMVSVESKSGNTRPHIALLMAYVVALAVAGLLVIMGIGIWNKDAITLEKITAAWPLVLAILATPTALLRAYFGMRTKEKQARYAAATGQPIAGVVSGIAGLLRR